MELLFDLFFNQVVFSIRAENAIVLLSSKLLNDFSASLNNYVAIMDGFYGSLTLKIQFGPAIFL